VSIIAAVTVTVFPGANVEEFGVTVVIVGSRVFVDICDTDELLK
jgi:hypothetical protein